MDNKLNKFMFIVLVESFAKPAGYSNIHSNIYLIFIFRYVDINLRAKWWLLTASSTTEEIYNEIFKGVLE